MIEHLLPMKRPRVFEGLSRNFAFPREFHCARRTVREKKAEKVLVLHFLVQRSLAARSTFGVSKITEANSTRTRKTKA